MSVQEQEYIPIATQQVHFYHLIPYKHQLQLSVLQIRKAGSMNALTLKIGTEHGTDCRCTVDDCETLSWVRIRVKRMCQDILAYPCKFCFLIPSSAHIDN